MVIFMGDMPGMLLGVLTKVTLGVCVDADGETTLMDSVDWLRRRLRAGISSSSSVFKPPNEGNVMKSKMCLCNMNVSYVNQATKSDF